MASDANTTRHEHKGPRCATAADTVCEQPSCRHDHHVSKHAEVTCEPLPGQPDVFACVHEVAMT